VRRIFTKRSQTEHMFLRGACLMESVRSLAEKYQTVSPYLLAQHLRIQVMYYDLPASVYGLYIPASSGSVIVLNKQCSDVQERFLLAYFLGVHLTDHKPSIWHFEDAHEVPVPPLVFALELLSEYGEFNPDSALQYYLEHGGVSSRLVLGLYESYLKAKSSLVMDLAGGDGAALTTISS
jgi:hypothetical protein